MIPDAILSEHGDTSTCEKGSPDPLDQTVNRVFFLSLISMLSGGTNESRTSSEGLR